MIDRLILAAAAVLAAVIVSAYGAHLSRLGRTATAEQVVLAWVAGQNSQDAQLQDAYYPGSSAFGSASASHIRCHTTSEDQT